MKFNLLAFESSSMFTSVALIKGNSHIYQEFNMCNDNLIYKHAENIIPMASKLLNDANINIKELTLLSFGNGPGSFIGTRIACGITNGISLALDIPILSFSSHEIMLEEIHIEKESIIFIASEAGNDEIYFSIYSAYKNYKQNIFFKQLQEIILISIKKINDFIQNFDKNNDFINFNKIIIGNAFSKHKDLSSLFTNAQYINIYIPKAKYLARLSKKVFFQSDKLPINSNLPIYIRNKIAFTIKERNDLKLNQI
ncbi:tRNA threonylcarbamoyladenosine biosynthesis protein TsaB [Candidatus Kinetoplastibacterium sorsogonicusi]|uniref:tRNA threonylcarbamoyladenosine biosynthesis protein TsaB n=1 Tax=Candidatus Kinetoplastidibacterium kentomonadis TaxID=1576550 RepID=A0A3Q8ERG6_9PROT|nr:tRNA (adenosine(37)-N6)-threonylcarbamoyltransferase complex dimerization subunit type 1 TsaB [Candidatus Kinetoplastibacterium sorsogonicusi]AWD32577.1 tRNA threonylcarbamoyladenosine biosynthesis protein TsaB [Candidatus Kinetoplastibacterium sorsogonicusi]